MAEAIGKSLEGTQAEVQVLPIGQVRGLDGYAGVVLGGPMIVGWHRRAARFFRGRRRELARVPVALFFTALRVTRGQGGGVSPDPGFPVLLDPRLLAEPARPGRLSFRERQTTVASYLRPVRTAPGPETPAIGSSSLRGLGACKRRWREHEKGHPGFPGGGALLPPPDGNRGQARGRPGADRLLADGERGA